MDCLHCGKKISALRKLHDEEFCSVLHRKAYLKKQNEADLDFLLQNRTRRKKKADVPEAVAEPESIAASQPPAAAPIPEPAGFMQPLVTPLHVQYPSRTNARPIDSPIDLFLPAPIGTLTPLLSLSHFTDWAWRGSSQQAHGRRAPARAVEFAGNPMEFPIAATRPLWQEPAPPKSTERPRAPLVRFRPVWVRAEDQPARIQTARPFVPETALVAVNTAPAGHAVRAAESRRTSVAAARMPALAQDRPAKLWQAPSKELRKPLAPGILPRAPVLPLSRHSASPVPRMRTPAAAAPSAPGGAWQIPVRALDISRTHVAPDPPELALCRGIAAEVAPASSVPVFGSASVARPKTPSNRGQLLPSCSLPLSGAALRAAPQAIPLALKAAAPSVKRVAGAMMPPANQQVGLGPRMWLSPVRPPFELLPVETVRRSVETGLSTHPLAKLAAFWRATPLRTRQLGACVLVFAAGWMAAGPIQRSSSFKEGQIEFLQRLRARAAVDLQDDFRSGLSQWTGPAGWANTWTYDATGFARPGRMALLAASMPLRDYRVEFLAEIDKKAVAWVFRAADARNYYACKLVEAKRGTGAGYSLVRYVVVAGREHSRMQLPLPVTATTRTMVRVRQEIRGDEFTTYLDGQVIDTWSDSSLARGGFGFFSDPGEAAFIRWANVAYQDDALGRVCAYLTSEKHH
jgi:hypothetical protein